MIEATPPFDTPNGWLAAAVHDTLDSAADGCIAEVSRAVDIDDALVAIREALSVLRLFQWVRREWKHQTTFALPGDLYKSTVRYVAVWERSAVGGLSKGHYEGWTFEQPSFEDWCASEPFQFLSEALRSADTEGARRAVAGALLFDRAATEHRPDLKMIGFASALEAWLLSRSPLPQTKRLARHSTWFGCVHDDECGRTRPICPYLYLKPNDSRDRKRLDVLRDLGDTYVDWRCSEWHRVVDWYEARSDAAHGRPDAVDIEEAEHAEYWISRHLAEPILLWLRDHPDRPIEDLEGLINSVPAPPNWTELVAALDASAPPRVPPWGPDA